MPSTLAQSREVLSEYFRETTGHPVLQYSSTQHVFVATSAPTATETSWSAGCDFGTRCDGDLPSGNEFTQRRLVEMEALPSFFGTVFRADEGLVKDEVNDELECFSI